MPAVATFTQMSRLVMCAAPMTGWRSTPDKRVREALHLAFRKFAEFGSVGQVVVWLCDEGIKIPIVVYGPRDRMVEWQFSLTVVSVQYDPSAVD
jgi:hypothetical protein